MFCFIFMSKKDEIGPKFETLQLTTAHTVPANRLQLKSKKKNDARSPAAFYLTVCKKRCVQKTSI